MRVHKINNVNKALDFIAGKGVKLVSIGAEGERLKSDLTGKTTCHSSTCLRLVTSRDKRELSLVFIQ